MSDALPLLALAGLGAFHGLNPAMGWLFAVALGLHRQSRAVVFVSLVPIAVGHAISIAAVASLLALAGFLIPPQAVRIGAGLLLLAWAAYHWHYSHRHRVRFGLRTGLLGLAAWSFLMATAHGAGLMLWPAIMPSCLGSGATTPDHLASVVLVSAGVHTLAMTATTIVVAGLVYEWLGVGILRRAWLNVDAAWMGALCLTGLLLILSS